jgi:hypothetical protein
MNKGAALKERKNEPRITRIAAAMKREKAVDNADRADGIDDRPGLFGAIDLSLSVLIRVIRG